MFLPIVDHASSPAPNEVLEAFLKAFPEAKNIGVIYSQSELEEAVKKLEESAVSKGVRVIKSRVSSIPEFSKSLSEMKGKVDTFWVIDESLFSIQEVWNYFINFNFRHQIKTVVFTEKSLSQGGLFYCPESEKIVINKRVMEMSGFKVSGEAGPVTYYSAKESQEKD